MWARISSALKPFQVQGSDPSQTVVTLTPPSKSRSRARSDTVFHARTTSLMDTHQEVNINDVPLALFSNQQVETGPFSVRAKMSYTSRATVVPTTPPQQPVREIPKEENIIYSLQTQLRIQTELCGQYEVDLRARDEMVKILNKKIAGMNEEENKKKMVFETWQKKVQELERNVRNLEELEVPMKGSVERSVTDDQHGEALRTLHCQIADLQREKAEWMKVERLFQEEMTKLEHLAKEKEYEVERFKELSRKEEYPMLRAELEAQWQHTEKASEKLNALEKERAQLNTEKETLKRELAILNDRATSLDIEWQESEAKRNELENELQAVWNEKEVLEKDRDQLEEQLQQEREQVDELTNALQEREDRITELDQEHKFTTESVSRLEENLRHQDQELSEYSIRALQREEEMEQLREELSALRRGQSRELDERTRKVHEAVEQAAEARAHLEETVRVKAELDVENKTNKDRVSGLKEEVERLRRQVHTLQQDSADKEVKVVQMTKQLEQKEDDIVGLNIALDSKQQELELMKRRQGVRGTAGTTPAQLPKIRHRHDTALDITPVPRPSSALSDASGRDSVLDNHRKFHSDSILTSSAIRISTLGKSTRVNAVMGSRASRKIEVSKEPPLVMPKPRVSISTPTPMSRPSSAPTQALAPGTPSTILASSRRVPSGTFASKGSSGNLNSSMAIIPAVEKENVSVRKRVPVPA